MFSFKQFSDIHKFSYFWFKYWVHWWIDQLHGLVVKAFACKADKLNLILSWVLPKTSKNGICCFSSIKCSAFKSCAEDKETVSGLYFSERKKFKQQKSIGYYYWLMALQNSELGFKPKYNIVSTVISISIGMTEWIVTWRLYSHLIVSWLAMFSQSNSCFCALIFIHLYTA